MTKLTDSLFIGSWMDAANIGACYEAGIKQIFCLDRDVKYETHIPVFGCGLNDQITGGPVNADSTIRHVVKELSRIIATNEPVLLHCAMGMNRTVAIASAWLITTGRAKNIRDGIRFIESKGHHTHVHPNLLTQMKRLYDR